MKKTKSGIIIKSEKDIEGIKKACLLSSEILDRITEYVKPWVSTEYLDNLMNNWIEDAGAKSACVWYYGYPKYTCISLNDTVCHWIPSKKEILKKGDILNIDVTTIVWWYFWDTSRMYTVWETSAEALDLIKDTHESLMLGIAEVKPWKHFGDIWYAISKFAKWKWYWVVKDFWGHGVGIKFHEEPFVAHIWDKWKGPKFEEGMIFTIEPMINLGTHKAKILRDDWTAKTTDWKWSAQFEHQILVTKEWCEILTEWNKSKYKYEIPTN